MHSESYPPNLPATVPAASATATSVITFVLRSTTSTIPLASLLPHRHPPRHADQVRVLELHPRTLIAIVQHGSSPAAAHSR